MEGIKIELDSRTSSIKDMISFLTEIETNPHSFYRYEERGTKKTKTLERKKLPFNSVISNIIKGSSLLMIYNIIEFVIIGSVRRIEQDFYSKKISDFNDDFKCLFLISRGYKVNSENFNTVLEDIKNGRITVESIIDYGYKNMDLKTKCGLKLKDISGNTETIKGNIDFKAIQKLGKMFNFNKIKGSKSINGENGCLLKEIKEKRNNLSHGDTSFENVGQVITTQQLTSYLDTVQQFLINYIAVIENYLEDKPYLLHNLHL